jgi:hypothetical protein
MKNTPTKSSSPRPERTMKSTSRQIAETILSQIKATNFWALGSWGAREFLVVGTGIQFRVSGSRLRGKIRIMLDPLDTYTVTSYRMRDHDAKIVNQFSGVYCDQLVSILNGIVG